ncbi:MAG: LacI family DNA-binding transcriptional regulator [Microbispora sp.]|nr:LacI family DNA-binding transcriptional regulator [Microbispora sp.]
MLRGSLRLGRKPHSRKPYTEPQPLARSRETSYISLEHTHPARVARRAGVSVATASRVASGALPVRREARERVERGMRELLYVPPGRRPDTGLVGVLVPELANRSSPALAQAIETRSAPNGIASILCNSVGVARTHARLPRGAHRDSPGSRLIAAAS